MQEIRSAKRAIILPLIGLAIAWLFFMVGIFTDQLVMVNQYAIDDFSEQELRWSTYLYLIGISVVSVTSLLGQRIALVLRNSEDFPLARAAHRFANLGIILSLLAGAIFAIGNFLGAFGGYDRDAPGLVRIFGVYVPIVLATALVVTILLLGFVFRKDAPDLKNERDEDLAKKQRAVGLAYATPILGTAVAILFGLAVYDITRTTLNVWIWVIIQLIIAVSILIGTRFAAKAKLVAVEPKPRKPGVAAVSLNFVLSILFGVVVTLMAFTYGGNAIDSLIDWEAYWEARAPLESKGEEFVAMAPEMRGADLGWWLGDMLPALVLLALAEIGIYKSIVTRNQEA
ncbi:MAG: hypothetical protein NWR78_02900 [Aquiluna sp.]|nr:hypothetical protein [Aquiluna sp.]